MKVSSPFLYFIVCQLLWSSVNSKISDTLLRKLQKVTSDREEVYAHNSVSTGIGPEGEVQVRSHVFNKNEDIHEIIIQPPFMGSYCNYKEYNNLFQPYYSIPFIRQDQRLHFNKLIIRKFELAGDTFAWDICQYGKLKLECTTDNRCECLSEDSPDLYMENENLSCVGAPGSICTNHTEAPIECEDGVDCIDGFCGGVETLAIILTGKGIQISKSWVSVVFFVVVHIFKLCATAAEQMTFFVME